MYPVGIKISNYLINVMNFFLTVFESGSDWFIDYNWLIYLLSISLMFLFFLVIYLLKKSEFNF